MSAKKKSAVKKASSTKKRSAGQKAGGKRAKAAGSGFDVKDIVNRMEAARDKLRAVSGGSEGPAKDAAKILHDAAAAVRWNCQVATMTIN
jgi:hypothetical protein